MSRFSSISGFLLFFILLHAVSPVIQPTTTISSPHISNQRVKAEYVPLIPDKFSGTKNITTFVAPDNAYSIITSYLRSAKKSIHLEVYSMSDYFLIKELYDAKARNTTMDISIILSHNHASVYDRNNTLGSAYNLTLSGISVYLSNSSLYFTHAKFWIIDGFTTFIYSGNWAKTAIPTETNYGNREWGIIVNDLEVSQYYENAFAQDLNISTAYASNPADETEMTLNIQTGNYLPQFTTQNYVENMTLQPIFSPDNSENIIRGLLQSANTSILVQQQYIKTKWSTVTNKFLQDLIDAKNRGVKVKVIVEGRNTDDAEPLREVLLTEGISLVYLDTRLEWCHNKGIIIDNNITIISSINWSYQAVNYNREAGIVIYSTNITNYYKTIFDYDWQNGKLQLTIGLSLDYFPIVILLALGGIGYYMCSAVVLKFKKSDKGRKI
ncbi:MAG: phosphatidylserine/phosphatidylglycerophosphate/cardiolipin synthase family protein [Promethearchaeota archaeon]